MLTVRDAHARVIAAFEALPSEIVSVADATGRVLAMPPAARLTQPPSDLSAMDGYAVRAADVPAAPATLKLVGQAPAGGSYDHALKPGETVTDDEVRDFCRGQIAHYKIPRYIRFVEEFPTTVTGKVRKVAMRETMIAELDLTLEKTA